MLSRGERLRILVFSRRHSSLPWMSSFPHVRGQVLADALRQLGVDAEFRALPVAGRYDVAICSDYQGDQPWMDALERRMAGLSAARMFCLADEGTTGHFSMPMSAWFARRGGVLCHLRERALAPYEHPVGVGVGNDVRFDPARARNAVLFDFPRSRQVDAAADFAPETLTAARRAHPSLRLLGSGPANTALREFFDEWVPYGLAHADYVAHFAGCLAYMPGCSESMGLAVAEAQVAGATIVCPPGRIKAEMLVPAAAVVDDDPVRGIARAAERDGAQIAREAAARFSATAMAKRVLAVVRESLACGVESPQPPTGGPG